MVQKRSTRVSILDLVLQIDDESGYSEEIARLLSTFETTTAPAQISYRIVGASQPVLYRNEELWLPAGCHEDFVSLFEAELYREILEANQRCPILHAAAICRGNQSIILMGQSGAGKSTLALAMMTRGAHYLSEEWVSLEEPRIIRGVSRPLHFDAPDPLGAGLGAPTQELGRSALHFPPSNIIHHGPVHAHALVCLKRVTGETSLHRLESSELLRALDGQIVHPGPQFLDSIAKVLEELPSFRLNYRGPEDACSALESLWNISPPSPV